jgi:low temperature requirement protein LtrA
VTGTTRPIAGRRGAPVHRDVDGDERVTPLELFFDLVFVFAITQVTRLIADEPTWAGLGKGLLVLTALWWAWIAYAWLTNSVNPEEGVVRIALFAAMAAMLVVSLAVPDAFGAEAKLFGAAYFVVRALHIVLYLLASRDDPALRRAVLRFAPPLLFGPALIFASAFTDGALQYTFWGVALTVDLLGPVIGGMEGWRVSPSHFSERHGLIIIIALGESIVSIGVGAEGVELGAAEVVAAILGVGVAATLWWAYFDVVALVAERRLQRATGLERTAMARDSYTYLHLPMVAGIVLLALGIKKTLGHVDDPLKAVAAVSLCGGVALYFVGHVLFRLRNVHSLNRQRLVLAALLTAFIPLAVHVPALAALAVVFALCAGLIAYEAIRFADARDRLRHAPEGEAAAAEALLRRGGAAD